MNTKTTIKERAEELKKLQIKLIKKAKVLKVTPDTVVENSPIKFFINGVTVRLLSDNSIAVKSDEIQKILDVVKCLSSQEQYRLSSIKSHNDGEYFTSKVFIKYSHNVLRAFSELVKSGDTSTSILELASSIHKVAFSINSQLIFKG